MKFHYSDGGRSNYFKATNVGDCVTRAICNATGKDYKEVYKALNELSLTENVSNSILKNWAGSGIRRWFLEKGVLLTSGKTSYQVVLS